MKAIQFLAVLLIGIAGAASPSLAACTGGLLANCPAASNLSGTADSVWVDQPSLAPHTGRKASPNEIVGAAAGAYPVLAATKMPVKPASQLPAKPAGAIAFATDCRYSGETAATATGCLVQVNASGSWVPVSSSATVGGSAASLTTVSGLTDWWDASALVDTTQTPNVTNMQSSGGTPVTAWDSPVGKIVSKGTGGHVLTVGGTGSVAYPKLVGLSGGVGNPNNFIRYVAWHWPVMSTGTSFTATTGSNFGANSNWSLMLVWSRPNTRQAGVGQNLQGTGNTGDVTLITVGTTKVLTMGGIGNGTDTLKLLPGGANANLGTMTRRHTHTIILTNTSGVGITAVLDGRQVATGVSASALGTSNTGNLLFLDEAGTTTGSAQLWFHEAAVWNRALGADDLATIDPILTSRYPDALRGNRLGIALIVNGQSNASYMFSTSAATPLLDAGLAYQLGVLAVTALNDDYSHGTGSYQIVSSNGIADRSSSTSGFLKNLDAPGPTFNPSTWPANLDTGVQININAQSAADQSDIAGIWMYWGENDSATWLYPDKATYNAIVKRQLELVRGYVTAVQPTANAANLPALMMPVPYGSFNNGAPMIREVYDDLSKDGVTNFYTYLQTFDSFSKTDSGYNATNGNWTFDSSNAPHRSDADNQKMARRIAPALAQMLMANGRCEYYCSFPSGVMTGQGPQITAAVRDGSNPALIHLTIKHDGGTDLIVSPGAATCHGFAVSKGTPSANTDLQCNSWVTGGAVGSVTKIDATHIDVLFPSSTTGYTKLYYPVPSAEVTAHMPIGPGNAVTDNWSTIAPRGWNQTEIGFPAENYPLQMPSYGIPIQ